MEIHPISHISSMHGYKEVDPVVSFNDDWNTWYNNPTKENCQKVINDIIEDRYYFRDLAAQFPPDMDKPTVEFEHACDAAELTLTQWIEGDKSGTASCDPSLIAIPSEYVADVAKWVNYVLPTKFLKGLELPPHGLHMKKYITNNRFFQANHSKKNSILP